MKIKSFRIPTFIIFIITAYISVFQFTEPKWKIPSDKELQINQNQFYPTGFQSFNIKWINNWKFLTLHKNSIYEYNIQTRSLNKIFSPQNDSTIQDFTINTNQKTLTVQTQNNTNNEVLTINLINSDNNNSTEIKYPKSQYSILGSESICLSHINQITKAQDIATEIQIYQTNQPQLNKDTVKKLQTNLTLIPIFCSSKRLILVTQSTLETQLYIWKTDQTNPERLEIPQKYLLGVTSIEIDTFGKRISFQNQNSILTVYNTDSESLNQFKIESSTWTVTDQMKIYLIKSENNYTKLEKSFFNTQINIGSLVKNENFSKINPSPNSINFAISSSNGDIWIYQSNSILNPKTIRQYLLYKSPNVWP